MSQPSSGRPLPEYVYRRRRLAVFGGLAVLLIVVLLFILRPWSGSASGGSTSSPAVIPHATATAPSTTAAATPATSAAAPTCAKSQVKVSAYTDAASYAAGQNPQLTMEVENTGSEPCTLNVGTSQQSLTITSGGDYIWLSNDCKTESSDYDLVLEPGQSVKSEPIIWDRTRSNPGTCTLTQRDPVPAGGASYQLSAAIGDITSADSTQFVLN